MAGKLEAWAKDNGVKYFLISFTDLFGAQRSKLVPASAIERAMNLKKECRSAVTRASSYSQFISNWPLASS